MHYFWGFIWVMIPLGGMATGIARRWMRMRERQFELTAGRSAEDVAQQAARTERLERRVAVLERILTDRSTRLDDEIEALRHLPAA
jgi:type II secretory pathway pseudopilin PulG